MSEETYPQDDSFFPDVERLSAEVERLYPPERIQEMMGNLARISGNDVPDDDPGWTDEQTEARYREIHRRALQDIASEQPPDLGLRALKARLRARPRAYAWHRWMRRCAQRP